MNKRHFLQGISAASAAPLLGFADGVVWAQASAPTPLPTKSTTANINAASENTPYKNLLILIELKGANDGLNTVVPFNDSAYAKLRPGIALKRDTLIALTEKEALHPSLQALMPFWQNKELAIVQGLGYPSANLSHFRSIEIWDTASKSDEYLGEGWLARAFAKAPPPKIYAADGVALAPTTWVHCLGLAHAQ